MVVPSVVFAAAESLVFDVVLVVELLESLAQATVSGRLVTPPRAQMDLAALRVAVACVLAVGERSRVGTPTLLVLLGAFVGHAAGNGVQEGLGLANAGDVNATLLGDSISRAAFLQSRACQYIPSLRMDVL